jgi:glutamate carboxypeptidase
MNVQEILQQVQANEARLIAALKQLVETESPSNDKAAVDRIGEVLLSIVPALGLKRHRSRTFGDVLELRFTPKRSKRSRVLLLGHLDTVWPIGTLKTMPWREDDGKLYGPGVLDMKSGVVMALEALAALDALGMQRPVTLLLNSDEEIGSPFSRAITEKIARQCSAVFVLEPAQGLAYKTARKGIGHYAVLEMARLVQTVSAFTDLSKGLTVNVGAIRGGTQSNVVAAECVAEVDVRIVKASDAARVDRTFRALKTTDKACKLTITGGINRPPMERKTGTVALFKQAKKLAAEIGFTLDEASTGGGSDGNFTAALGTPTLDGMGSIGAGAHAAHEHIVSKHLVERTALLAAMIASVD